MKILQLCSKVPYPPRDGGSVAMHILTEGLMAAGMDVNVFSISTGKHPVQPEKMDPRYLEKTKFESVYINTSVTPAGAFRNLFTGESYNLSRFYAPEAASKLRNILQKETYDIIQLETLFATPYLETLRKNSNAKIIYRSQNIEFMIWEKLARQEKFFLKKLYLQFLSRRLKKYELEILNTFDGIAAITPVDAECMRSLGCRIPIEVIPFGINLETIPYRTQDTAEKNSLFHLGAMDWRPNVEAVDWFLENVWKKITEKNLACRFYLAGKNMPGKYLNSGIKNLEVAGEVKSASDFMRSKSIMIVPLFSGSGIRIKIIEGMALGKTIISTRTGASGIAVEDGKNILLADTPEEFINAIQKCLENPSFCESIGRNARSFTEEHYDNNKIIRNLTGFYRSLLQKG